GDPDCDDGVDCTDDFCDAGVCLNTPDNTLCPDDGWFCNGTESCDAQLGCVSSGDPCAGQVCDDLDDVCVDCLTDTDCIDRISCTEDACDLVTHLCVHTPNDVACDNGFFCDGAEWCHSVADCQTGMPVDCDDGVACTDDACNEGTESCDNLPNDANCDNGFFCDGAEWCDPVADCQAGNDPCPGQPCNESIDACGDCSAADPPTEEPNPVPKNRYVSFVPPGNDGRATALRVTFTSLPAPFDGHNGETMWVGQPREVTENAGHVDPTQAPGWPTFMRAALQCDPYYTDWSTYGAVHVSHAGIVPDGDYAIQAIDQACDSSVESDYSISLQVTTSIWGDIVSNCIVQPCGPPDGVVNITTDVTAALDKFRNLPGTPMKARCDVEPDEPDLLVNISDVMFILDAFRGFDYPFTGPQECS
ncbi:MAG: hypothetical protein JSU86_08300, partial [Phycisphaerales bacterium]